MDFRGRRRGGQSSYQRGGGGREGGDLRNGLMGVSGKFTSVKPIESAVYKPQEMYFSPWAFI